MKPTLIFCLYCAWTIGLILLTIMWARLRRDAIKNIKDARALLDRKTNEIRERMP